MRNDRPIARAYPAKKKSNLWPWLIAGGIVVGGIFCLTSIVFLGNFSRNKAQLASELQDNTSSVITGSWGHDSDREFLDIDPNIINNLEQTDSIYKFDPLNVYNTLSWHHVKNCQITQYANGENKLKIKQRPVISEKDLTDRMSGKEISWLMRVGSVSADGDIYFYNTVRKLTPKEQSAFDNKFPRLNGHIGVEYYSFYSRHNDRAKRDEIADFGFKADSTIAVASLRRDDPILLKGTISKIVCVGPGLGGGLVLPSGSNTSSVGYNIYINNYRLIKR